MTRDKLSDERRHELLKILREQIGSRPLTAVRDGFHVRFLIARNDGSGVIDEITSLLARVLDLPVTKDCRWIEAKGAGYCPGHWVADAYAAAIGESSHVCYVV